MTTEDAFWQTLEADPSDRVTRLIFADWLAQEGRAAEANGQRWQARNGQWPFDTDVVGVWEWWKPIAPIPPTEFDNGMLEASLPLDVWKALSHDTRVGSVRYYPTLRAAETALAQALHALEL